MGERDVGDGVVVVSILSNCVGLNSLRFGGAARDSSFQPWRSMYKVLKEGLPVHITRLKPATL